MQKFRSLHCVFNRIDFKTIFRIAEKKANRSRVQKNEPCQQENGSLFVFPLVLFNLHMIFKYLRLDWNLIIGISPPFFFLCFDLPKNRFHLEKFTE